MGWRSTMNITRADALREIFSLIQEATDNQLEDILFNLQDDPLHNYEVVPEYDESPGEAWKNYKGHL